MKILLIRLSSIGDIVLTSPVIRAIKTQLNPVVLHVITRKSYRSVYANNPYIDKVITVEKSPVEVIELLKAEKYDLLIDLHKNLRSFKLRISLGIKTVTFPKLNWQKYLLVRFKINRMPDVHIVDRYFEAVKSLGVVNDQKGLDFFIDEEEIQNLPELPDFIENGFFAVVIGGNHNTKILPVSKLVEVIRQLPKAVILLGGKEDQERGKEIESLLNDQVWNACGKLTLSQSAEMIRRADAVLTNDTGLMHIAAAFNKPVVSVWGNTVPQLGMYPYIPAFPELVRIIENNNLSCRPCSKIGFERCPKGHFKCMMDLDDKLIAKSLIEISRSPQKDY
jgi:heptosyltransferase-2